MRCVEADIAPSLVHTPQTMRAAGACLFLPAHVGLLRYVPCDVVAVCRASGKWYDRNARGGSFVSGYKGTTDLSTLSASLFHSFICTFFFFPVCHF